MSIWILFNNKRMVSEIRIEMELDKKIKVGRKVFFVIDDKGWSFGWVSKIKEDKISIVDVNGNKFIMPPLALYVRAADIKSCTAEHLKKIKYMLEESLYRALEESKKFANHIKLT